MGGKPKDFCMRFLSQRILSLRTTGIKTISPSASVRSPGTISKAPPHQYNKSANISSVGTLRFRNSLSTRVHNEKFSPCINHKPATVVMTHCKNIVLNGIKIVSCMRTHISMIGTTNNKMLRIHHI